MNFRAIFIVAVLWFFVSTSCSSAWAAAIVLQNQTEEKVEFTIQWAADTQSRHTLLSGDLRPIAAAEPITVGFASDGKSICRTLQPNSIHQFVRRNGRLELAELRLPDIEGYRPLISVRPRSKPQASGDEVYSIPVKILADDQEPRVREIWEKRLRDRISDASDIFERCCRVRFKVASVETWNTNTAIDDFNQAVADFEQKVSPAPGRLAVGFTGHFKWEPGEKHVGGIRGPLRTHILIREALIKVSEPERLEVLVHELGHYLGAVHASDGNSVMRPTLGDRKACAKGFRIGFDAPNTLAMYLLCEQLRAGPLVSLHQLPTETKDPLRRVYAWLAGALPDDPAAPKYMTLLGFAYP